ncbi:MAG TPA: AAA family ATPase [Bradyrhizobium sp.]|nr:AAA family ATPase [Bradyrhizobium sp.]
MTQQPKDGPNGLDSNQAAVLAFLGRGGHGLPPKRIDTHISIVFLEPDRVLKIKRAVRLPFLDYSTLDKRKHACEEELAINKRHAPQLYRRVIPITRDGDRIEIDGRGTPIEWALEMARFDETKTLDHLCASGGISADLADQLAEVMRASHEHAEISDGSTWLSSISGIIDRNTQKFRKQAALPGEAVDQLDALSHRQLAANRDLLQQRAVAGLVRRCHGDAHLGNIVLIDQKPLLFDAIEFDPAMATIDVLYDLAFPIMDLLHFEQHLAANRLFNDYLRKTWRSNGDALRLFPLFLSMRAAIRSLVLFTRCEQDAGQDSTAADAKSYFELALHLIMPARPSLVAIGGRSGTGKTVLARSLAGLVAPSPGAVVLRSDIIRKELFGVGDFTALPESAYRPEVSERVYRTMDERARDIIAQGFSVILDAAFLQQNERHAAALAAREIGATFRPIFLTADSATRQSRVGARRHDASDATRDIAARQDNMDIGQLDWPTVDASGSPEQTLKRSTAQICRLQ